MLTALLRAHRPRTPLERATDAARRHAHLALAGIRMVNGTLALVAPAALARRLGVDANASPGILYFERMFGIRTVLIALDLLDKDPDHVERALREGRVIHATDALGAVLAGARGNLAPRPAAMTTAISLVNLTLALIARPAPRTAVAPRRRAGRLRRSP
jgi:hypothetical protein